MTNPCSNPTPHEAGTLPCCAGIIFRDPNPNSEEAFARKLDDMLWAHYQVGNSLAKAKILQAHKSAIQAAEVALLNRLLDFQEGNWIGVSAIRQEIEKRSKS